MVWLINVTMSLELNCHVTRQQQCIKVFTSIVRLVHFSVHWATLSSALWFLCLCHVVWPEALFSGYSWVCLSIPNIVNTISWKVLDFTKLSTLVPLGQGWTHQVLGSECQSLRSWWAPTCWKMNFFGLVNFDVSWKLLDWISPNFQHWCILEHQCLGQRSRSQSDAGPVGWRRTELDAELWFLV